MKEKKVFLYLSSVVIAFICFFVAMVAVSPAIGTLFVTLNIKWGVLAFSITIILSILLGIILYKMRYFDLENSKELLGIAAVILFSAFIYASYSPVLEIRQDPALYIFKALNLVNYGYVYKPLNELSELVNNGIVNINDVSEYAAIQNGTIFDGYNLDTDFYPGAAFFYAVFGFINKPFIFYGQTVIMVLNSALMFLGLNKICLDKNKNFTNAVFVMAFMIAPVIVWFGRGSYCEPVSMTYFLILFNIIAKGENKTLLNIITEAAFFMFAVTARIDYGLIMLVGVIVITKQNNKAGLIYSLLCILVWILMAKSYWFYYNRITSDNMPILKYMPALILFVYAFCFVLFKYFNDKFINFYYSKPVNIICFILSVFMLLLMFRENIVSDYEMAIIHEQELRTYAEAIWYLLFMAFPFYVLIAGMYSMNNFLNKKLIGFTLSLFLFGCFLPYLYLFFKPGNSPQLYWLLRRYFNIIIPVLFISFVLTMDKYMKSKVGIAFCCFTFIFSVGMFINSKQTVDYDGLDKSVIAFEEQLKEKNVKTIFYTEDIRYNISSLFSYSDIDFVPLLNVDLQKLEVYLDNNSLNNAIVLSENIKNIDVLGSYTVTCTDMNESYEKVPKETRNQKYDFNQYDLNDLIKEYADSYLYPRVDDKVQVDGFFDGGIWTKDTLDMKFSDKVEIENKNIAIMLTGDTNVYIENNDFNSLNLRMYINSDIEIRPYKFENNIIYFDLSDYYGIEVSDIQIKVNTFVPKELGMNEDIRSLGIPIDRIYFCD